MTQRTVKAMAVTMNVALLVLTTLIVTARGLELESWDVPLFLLMILAPVLSTLALYWPGQSKLAVPAPGRAAEGQG